MSRFSAAIILLAIGISVLVFLVWPAYTSLMHERDLLANQNAAIGKLDSIIKSRNRLQEEYGSLSASDSAKLNDLIPSGQDIKKLLVGVGALASKNGMSLNNIDFTAQASGPAQPTAAVAGVPAKQNALPYQTLSFHFSVLGSYESFLQFLNDIQLSVRPIDITEITFSGGRNRIYEFSLKANTYFLGK